MSETVRLSVNTEGLRESLDEVRTELSSLVEQDINPLAESVSTTFRQMGDTIADELGQAAERGRLSMRSLVNGVLEDLSRLAADQLVRRPIEGALTQFFGGARAGGGMVAPGQAFLVGERGPEMFVPSTSGHVGGAAARPVNVTVNMNGGSDSFARSRSQVAAAVSRALARAGRNG